MLYNNNIIAHNHHTHNGISFCLSTSTTITGREEINPDDRLLLGMFSVMVKESKKSLDACEFVHAAEWLVQLHSLCTPTRLSITHPIARLSQLCSSDTGKMRCTRDAVDSLSNACATVKSMVETYLSKEEDATLDESKFRTSRKLGQSNAEEQTSKELSAIRSHYIAISASMVEIKRMVLALLRDVRCSEFQHGNDAGLLRDMWALFEGHRQVSLSQSRSKISETIFLYC